MTSSFPRRAGFSPEDELHLPIPQQTCPRSRYGINRLKPGGSTMAFAAIVLLAVGVLLRFVALVRTPLVPEEAYYWMYTQHPNLSYYDHPPMVSWVIGLGTSMFGNTELGVRVVGTLLMLGASALLYAYAKMWFGRRPAILSALALQLLPGYFAAGFVATMDSALIFSWLVCLIGVTVALRRGATWGWYVAGFGMGAAMLAKYTGVFLGVGAFIAVVVHRPWRWHLRSPHPYLAALLAAAMFSPVLVWNAQHEWASFRFQLVGRFAGESFKLRFVLEFLLYQVLVVTPIVLWGMAVLCRRALAVPTRLLRARNVVTASFSLPLLLVMSYKSLWTEIHINWTLPAFLSLIPAVSHWLLSRVRLHGRPRQPRGLPREVAWTAVVCGVVNVGLMVYLLTLQSRLQWMSAFGPWRQLAELVEEHEDRLERETGREPLIIGDGKYRLASVLAFYRTPLESQVHASQYTTSEWILGSRGLAYPYWAAGNDWEGIDCVYVADGALADVMAATRNRFASVEIVDDPRLQSLGRVKYRLAICRGLRGVPPILSSR